VKTVEADEEDAVHPRGRWGSGRVAGRLATLPGDKPDDWQVPPSTMVLPFMAPNPHKINWRAGPGQ